MTALMQLSNAECDHVFLTLDRIVRSLSWHVANAEALIFLSFRLAGNAEKKRQKDLHFALKESTF
jgi:hypothetical protein